MYTSPVVARRAAEQLLDIQAVLFLLEQPIRFKSGLISPVYVDNRRLIAHPQMWTEVLDALMHAIATRKLLPDIIAGVETAAIPHSSVLGYRFQLPTVFVRKQTKTHGTKNRVEGGDVKGKHVLLIEDHISTGVSSLDGIAALREAGAIVTDCLSITSYGFSQAQADFEKAGVKPHTLLPFDVILDVAERKNYFSEGQKACIAEWLADPWPWAERYSKSPNTAEN